MNACIDQPTVLELPMLVHCRVCLETNVLHAGEYWPAFCMCGEQLDDAEALPTLEAIR